MFYVNQSNAYLKRFVYGRKSIYLLQVDYPYSIQNSFFKKISCCHKYKDTLLECIC